MKNKVDIDEISEALLASAAREEELLTKNASLQKELDELRAEQASIPFIEPAAELSNELAATAEEEPFIQTEVTLGKEASSQFEADDMGQVASHDDQEVYSSASARLTGWLDDLSL